jgi:hypothetical protein
MESTKQACNILQHFSQFFLLLAIVITILEEMKQTHSVQMDPNGPLALLASPIS